MTTISTMTHISQDSRVRVYLVTLPNCLALHTSITHDNDEGIHDHVLFFHSKEQRERYGQLLKHAFENPNTKQEMVI